jgi:hypothetical protein
MHAHTSSSVPDGDLPVRMNPGNGDPFGIIEIGGVAINIDTDEDADRIIRAAATLKAMRATLGTPHPYESLNDRGYGACARCGMLPGWADHAAPCPSIAPHAGRRCERAAGHDGGHEAGMIVWSRDTARSAS